MSFYYKEDTIVRGHIYSIRRRTHVVFMLRKPCCSKFVSLRKQKFESSLSFLMTPQFFNDTENRNVSPVALKT